MVRSTGFGYFPGLKVIVVQCAGAGQRFDADFVTAGAPGSLAPVDGHVNASSDQSGVPHVQLLTLAVGRVDARPDHRMSVAFTELQGTAVRHVPYCPPQLPQLSFKFTAGRVVNPGVLLELLQVVDGHLFKLPQAGEG